MKTHLAALAAALLLAAPSAAFAQAGSKGAVKVGVLLPLTGNTAWAGKTNRIAAAIAAEEVNAQDLAGGYKIELVFGDSQCEPRAAHDQAQRLISQEKVQLLIGEWCSSASIAVAQVANDEKIPLLVNISTADQIAGDAGPYAFQSSMQNRYAQQREAALLQKDFKFRLGRDHRREQRLRPHLPQEHDRADAEGRQEDRARRHAGSQRHQLVFDHHAHPERQAGPRDRVDLGGARRRTSSSNTPRAGITTPLFSDYPPPPRIFERQVGAAGRQDRPGARGLLHQERHQHAGAEGVRRQARGARAEGAQRGASIRRTGTSRATTRSGWWPMRSSAADRKAADYAEGDGARRRSICVLGHYEFDAERGVKPEGLNFLFIRTKPDGSTRSRSIARCSRQILINGLVLSGSYALVAVGLTLDLRRDAHGQLRRRPVGDDRRVRRLHDRALCRLLSARSPPRWR